MSNYDYFVVSLDEIVELGIMWNHRYAVIPRSAIKSFEYEINTNRYYGWKVLVSWATLEIDLDYVKNEYAVYGDNETNDKIIDLLNDKNILFFQVETNDNRSMRLDVPEYRKDFLLGEDGVDHGYCNNVFETHEKRDETYVIEFKVDESKLNLSFSELMQAFNSSNVLSSRDGGPFQIEVLCRRFGDIYYDNERKREKESLLRLVRRLRNYCVFPNETMLGVLKKNYQYSVSGDGKLVRFVAKNHSYKTEVNFVFVSEIDDVNQCNGLLPLKDSLHYTSGIVVIYGEGIDKDELIKRCGEDDIIYFSYDKINEYWRTIICNWYLGIGDEYIQWDFK